MKKNLRIRLLQLNAAVGDFDANLKTMIDELREAKLDGIDVLVAPELAISGYPPEDLLLRPALCGKLQHALNCLADAADGVTLCVGAPEYIEKSEKYGRAENESAGVTKLWNSLWVFEARAHVLSYHKQVLPNYQVFDERRYFLPGDSAQIHEVKGVKLGLLICEDVWVPEIVERTCLAGADLLLVINASPFSEHKYDERIAEVRDRALKNGLPIAYVNLVGGQDELVFDGGSFAISAQGDLVARARFFLPDKIDLEYSDGCLSGDGFEPAPLADELLYKALVLGVRDYFNKTGFSKAFLGLSGGIDSALTLAIAVDALGAKNVHAVMMPFLYTAEISLEDAREQAKILGCEFSILSIDSVVHEFIEALDPFFLGHAVDSTEENLQSRCRGVLLMALANKTGALVLTTGNKSEMAVGYATLYGDMAGGFAVLKDVWKTRVYELSRYVNRDKKIIPERVITRPPSAELAPDQQDSDSLPPYDQLDPILSMYVEDDLTPSEIIAKGFTEGDVLRMCRLVDISEHKRRQSAVGPRTTSRGFGRDRRYPIANRWKF